MTRILTCVLAIAWVVMLAGCSEGGGKTASEKQFEDLYKQYSARFYDRVTLDTNLMPNQITPEAARIWDEVYGPHKALLTKRSDEELKNLDAAPTVTESTETVNDKPVKVYTVGGTQYNEVFNWKYDPNTPPPSIVPKQFLWNPISAAFWNTNDILSQIIDPASRVARQIEMGNANLFWQAIDRNVEKPRLLLKQGPLIFLVDLVHKDDYYQATMIQMLVSKSVGPLAVRPGGTAAPAATGQSPATTEMPPAATGPAATAPAKSTAGASAPRG